MSIRVPNRVVAHHSEAASKCCPLTGPQPSFGLCWRLKYRADRTRFFVCRRQTPDGQGGLGVANHESNPSIAQD